MDDELFRTIWQEYTSPPSTPSTPARKPGPGEVTTTPWAPDQVTVLCVRVPDDANEYVIDAPGTVAVTVVTADLGYAYLGNWAEFVEWAAARLADADALPEGTNVRSAIENLVWQMFVRHNHQAVAPGVTDTPSLRPLLTTP